MRKTLLAASFVICAATANAEYRQPEPKLVTCASTDGTYNTCFAGSEYIFISQVHRHSQAECKRDRDYGLVGGTIWVDNGCRASFILEGSPYPLATSSLLVRCASSDNSYKSCQVAAYANVQLFRQVSSAKCKENDSWGYNAAAGAIWVDNGCRADFIVEH